MTDEPQKASEEEWQRVPLPAGYRQGIITAITVLLGFSLVLARWWDLEAPGTWTLHAVIAAALQTCSIMLQLVALWRSLQVKDDDEREYSRTLQWFLAGAIVLLMSLALTVVSSFIGAKA